MRYFPLFLAAVVWLGASIADAQTAKIQKQVQKKLDKARAEQEKKAEPATLDQLIAEALRNNPDILVGQAKLREAEAETARVRLKVAAELAALHADIAAARAAVKEGKGRYDTLTFLYTAKKAIAREDYAVAVQTYMKLERELAAKDVKLPYLVGRPVQKKPDAAPATFDELIADAMKNNPDIRVAEAKLREAEAETARTRLRIAGEVAALHAEIEAARAAAEEGKDRFERARYLFQVKKAMPPEDFEAATRTYEKLKRELAAKEARLPYLLGRPVKTAATTLIDDLIQKTMIESQHAAATDDEFLRRATLDILGRVPTANERREFMSLPEKTRRQVWVEQLTKSKTRDAVGRAIQFLARPQLQIDAPMSQKLLKALATPIKLEVDGISQKDLLIYVREHLPGVNLHVRAKAAKKDIALAVTTPIPTGAFLQLVEDELGVTFILRDYGIVVVANDERLPPGAVRVVDWWKQKRNGPGQ